MKILKDGKGCSWDLPKKDKTPKEFLTNAREFVESLSKIPWLVNDGNPNPEWRLFKTSENAWSATNDFVRNGSWTSARDAIYAAQVFTGRCVAGSVVWDRLIETSNPAEWDTSLLAQCFLVDDVIDPIHFKHLKKRMEVWQKGYGLFCDVDGVLFVYKRI